MHTPRNTGKDARATECLRAAIMMQHKATVSGSRPSVAQAALRPAWLRYGMAVLIAAIALPGRMMMTASIGATALPFIFFFPAVAAAAWYGGLGPGLLATVLAAVAADWFFIEPLHTLAIGSAHDALALLAFIGGSLLIALLIESMHRSRRRLAAEIVAGG